MSRRQPSTGLTNNYSEIAEIARREMSKAARTGNMMAARQAVNKSYLAVVHAARTIVDCSGVTFEKRASARSTQDMGRVATMLGQRSLKDPKTSKVLQAFSKAAGQHTVCFYDGLCNMNEMKETVTFVAKALKNVPHACQVIQRHAAT